MDRRNDRGDHISPHATVSWEERPATLAEMIEGDGPGDRMRREKERLATPDLDIDRVAERLHAMMMANAQPRVKDNVVVARSGLTPSGTPYEVAMSLEGLTERRRDGSLNPLIEQFHQATFFTEGTGDDAWCSSFMNWCCMMAGYTEYDTDSPRARSWTKHPKFTEDTRNLHEGDIVVFSRGKNTALGHVAFATTPMPHGNTIDVLGGNQSNMVCVKPYPIDRLLGYIPVM